MDDPLSKTKADYADLIAKISTPDSPVGIDAALTHAVIIEYLRRISDRLESFEQRLAALEKDAGQAG